ncbi:hypothetical protein CXF86_19930 [Shewanella sp. GutCb]|uniref:hypothetical protein n=1 Tax=Shewanella sp. GutCb TaxID=2058315 RepID=UPI000C7AB7A9|nr:hypothetical protein [Shewanella sp. GutCb]PKG73008.1 hypothetical protein CXF86_19930 [Shewanella sp. GutCb]
MNKVREILDTIASCSTYDKVVVKELMNELEKCHSYCVDTWTITEIEAIDKSLAKLAENSFASNFLQDIKKLCLDVKGEAYLLVKFYFELNYLKNKTNSLNEIRNLKSEYSENHAYSYQFIKMVNDLEDRSIELLEDSHQTSVGLVMKTVKGPALSTYTNQAINLSIKLLYKYIAQHDFTRANSFIEELDHVKPFTDSYIFTNILAGLPYAVEQSEALYNLNKLTLEEMEGKVKKISEDSNKRSFEILIVFTAVITFLVTAAGVTTSDTTSVPGLASLGLILVVFIVTAIICLDRPKNIFSDPRILVLILALLSSLGIALIDKYDKFELWSDKTVHIEFYEKQSEVKTEIQVPFRL